MSADPLHLLNTLIQVDFPPEELTIQVTQILSSAARADWAGLYVGNSEAHTFQTIHQHPELPTALLAYLDQRTRSRSRTPLTRTAFEHTRATFVDNYKTHPDAQHGAVCLGVTAVAHVPLGHHADQAFIATVLRVSTSPTLAHSSPWTEDERTLIDTASHTVQVALARRK